ncbi:fimbrial protein [Klebsiella pneumoniae]|nr:fimbrial protein [Klebsiella pneumoniae]WLX64693.1 fimbrial protein [Klebsiella pneumoniae]
MLCHGTVCVVGKIRDLILQLSKSSIYSTKPAQGVGVRLLDQDGKAIELGSETEYPLGNGATIIYQAYVEANGNTVTAGDIRSDATFKLNYK